MKRKLLPICFFAAILFNSSLHAQSITPFALNTAGGSYDNPASYSRFEWNFGELTLTDTYTNTGINIILTQGLLQPCTDKVGGEPEILLFGNNEYKIFPNVTTGLFELDFFLILPGQMELQLTDALGRVINTRSYQYHCCQRIERYDISALANGIYFINARYTPERGNLAEALRVRRESTFRIVKVN
jgi:hypothetical protein